MVNDRFKFFESTDVQTLEYEVNEFAKNALPEQYVEILDIKREQPFICTLWYRLKKSENEIIAELQQLRNEEIKNPIPITEEELKKIAQENQGKNNNKEKGDSTTSPTPTIRPPLDSPPMAPQIAVTTTAPTIIDKDKPIDVQPEVIDWIKNMFSDTTGSKVIKSYNEEKDSGKQQ